MANSLTKSIILDGWRNAVVKLTGVLDSSDVVEAPAIRLSDFTNNEVISTLSGFRVDRMTYVIGQGIEVQLAWNGLAPQMIAAVAGRGTTEGLHYGGWAPNQQNPGYDGNINLTTTGYALQLVAGTVQNFSVILEMTKLYTT